MRTSTNTVIHQTSVADELKKVKELLDMGIIGQEEFNAKKKHGGGCKALNRKLYTVPYLDYRKTLSCMMQNRVFYGSTTPDFQERFLVKENHQSGWWFPKA